MPKKPWDDRWNIVAAISGGGQGSTHKVESKTDGSIGCMKLLSDNKSTERRERFRRECVAFETLKHPRIPAYLDSNSEQFRTNERLFLVTEFIDGTTLSKSPRIAQDIVLGLVVDLLRTMEYVHSQDVVHRDIKPDNIILRNDDPADPVIVDFGLSYNEDFSSLSTASLQQIGNRFLHLPELQTQSGDKRNPISDVTQLVGILLFLLSGHPPVILVDDKGHAPHQRDPIRAELEMHAAAATILPVFDRGFRQSLPDRWQSASQLSTRLNSILNPPEANSDAAKNVADFTNRLLQSPEYSRRVAATETFREFENTVKEVFTQVLAEFKGQPFGCGTNSSTDMPKLTYTRNQYLSVKTFSEVRVLMAASCSIVGNELVIQTKIDKSDDVTEIGRVSALPPREWTDVKSSLRDEIIRVIGKVIQPQLPGI